MELACNRYKIVQKTLKNIELFFLPPNTTAKSQPMGQGIIANLKVKCRKLMLKKLVNTFDDEDADPKSITLLDGLRFLKSAWYAVTSTPIANCFKHCGFVSKDQATCIFL